MSYYSYKQYLIDKYHEKVYTLPIHIPVTCPNRDHQKRGCSFCSSLGTGFEASSAHMPIKEQLKNGQQLIQSRYNASKFIGYFQNYTNTNLPVKQLIKYMDEVIEFGVVGIDIATRPDCIDAEYLNVLKHYAVEKNIAITFEIGLQIANDDILGEVNRGHTVKDYIDGVRSIQTYQFPICTHLILNLPNTTVEDVQKTVNLMNVLQIDIVKLHSLYIPTDCDLSTAYLNNEVDICSFEEYVERVICFITHLDPSIAISRLVSRIPQENALFSNWGMSWWRIYNTIMSRLSTEKLYQGMYFKEGKDESIKSI